MSAFEDVVEAWGFKVAGDKPVALSPAGIAPDGSIVYSDAESFRDLIGAEPELGSPSVNGWILSSSSAGVRSWVAPNAHAHAIADVTGLQSALDAKMSTASYPDLVAIEALAGTSGLLRKTAANTWSLDTASYALSSAIPAASWTLPAALGTAAAVGIAWTWARADHVHVMPTAAQVGAPAIIDVATGGTFQDSDPFTSRETFDSRGGVRTVFGAGPFGNGFYNLIDVRHRNGSGDGADAYGGMIAWNMLTADPRVAIRSRPSTAWGSWHELWTSISLPASTLGKSLLNSADQAAARATLGAGTSNLALGETSTTAYRGDRGKTAYDHSQAPGNPHGTTAAQVGAPAIIDVATGGTFQGSDPFTSRETFDSRGGVRTVFGAGPFGNNFYNVIDVRHRNGSGDGADAYGGMIAWNMLTADPRVAIRSRPSAAWGSWHELWTSISLPASTLGKSLLNSADQAAARATLGAAAAADTAICLGSGFYTVDVNSTPVKAAEFTLPAGAIPPSGGRRALRFKFRLYTRNGPLPSTLYFDLRRNESSIALVDMGSLSDDSGGYIDLQFSRMNASTAQLGPITKVAGTNTGTLWFDSVTFNTTVGQTFAVYVHDTTGSATGCPFDWIAEVI